MITIIKALSGPMSGSRHRCLAMLLLLTGLVVAGTATALDVEGNYYALSDEFAFLEDPAGTITIEQLLANPGQHQFTPAAMAKPRGDFRPVWLKLELNFHQTAVNKSYFLFGRLENFFDLRIYRPDANGQYSEWVTGNDYPASSREVDAFRYGFSIPASAEPATVYIRYVGGPGTNNLAWDFTEEEYFTENSRLYYMLDVACFAAIGALLVFNLIIAVSLRRSAYFYYCAYMMSVTMALVTIDGIGFYYVWPDAPALNERVLHTLNMFSAGFRLLAIFSFLGIARLAPGWHRAGMAVLAMLAVGVVLVNVRGITNLPPLAPTIPWAIAIFFGFAVCIVAIRQRIKLAIPLFLTLLVPTTSAVAQGLQSVYGNETGVLVLLTAKTGFVLYAMLFSVCLAAQIKIETESRVEAMHDGLTGLPQSLLLEERFEWSVDLLKRKNWKMAVLFVDLDGFKRVNDTLGHAAGDQLLQQVAQRMKNTLRKTDYVARIGGDEFAVLLLDSPQNFAVSPVTKKLLSALSKPYQLDRGEATISASIGVALHRRQGDSLDTLIKVADAAMYEAKGKGKNTYVVYGDQPPLSLVKTDKPVALA